MADRSRDMYPRAVFKINGCFYMYNDDFTTVLYRKKVGLGLTNDIIGDKTGIPSARIKRFQNRISPAYPAADEIVQVLEVLELDILDLAHEVEPHLYSIYPATRGFFEICAILRVIENMRIEDIAWEFDITPNTFRTFYYRANMPGIETYKQMIPVILKYMKKYGELVEYLISNKIIGDETCKKNYSAKVIEAYNMIKEKKNDRSNL